MCDLSVCYRQYNMCIGIKRLIKLELEPLQLFYHFNELIKVLIGILESNIAFLV